MRNVTGEQLAQVDNPDPFASPVWRSPVYRTPEGVIYLVQALRGLWRLAWFLIRHPLLDLAAGLLVLLWHSGGWPALAALGGGLAACLAGLGGRGAPRGGVKKKKNPPDTHKNSISGGGV
jgi:hypothetical protein